MSEKGNTYLSTAIRNRMKSDGKRFWAGDNISEYIAPSDKEHLINEATEAFEQVLDTLLIDRETDPNSHGTARRLAKMYFNEIMAGRYDPAPDATAFPNDSQDRYEGMLVVRSELRSMCSHHHQPVSGDNISEYIAPSDKEHLINEATEAFEQVLDTLLIS